MVDVNLNLDELFESTQAAQQDVEKYEHKDKIEEIKKKEEKQAAKEQKKVLQETLHETPFGKEKDKEDESVIKLKKKIKEYESNKILGPHLEKCGFKFDKAYAKDTPEKLERQIAKIEKLLSGKTADDGVNSGIKIVMTGLERMISAKTEADITGLTQCCFGDQQWLFLLERVKMKYGLNGFTLNGDPGFDLLLATLVTGMSVYQLNLLKKRSSSTAQKYNLDAPAPQSRVSVDPVDTSRPPAPGLGDTF